VPASSTGAASAQDVAPPAKEAFGAVRSARPGSWASSGGFVSIVPSASAQPRPSTSPNLSASITPIFAGNSAAVAPSLSPGPGGLKVDAKPSNPSSKSQHLVQVTAGGKSFSLTIAQFKKLQALRQQRQIDQQKKGRRPAQGSPSKSSQRRASASEAAKEVVSDADKACEDDEMSGAQESFVPMICDVRSVTSSDQAITMWDEPERTDECKLNPQLEITPIEAPPAQPKDPSPQVTHVVSSEMKLTTLVPSRALACDPLAAGASLSPSPGPAALLAAGPLQAIAPSLSPSLVAPIPAGAALNPIHPIAADVVPVAGDAFPN